MFAEPLSHPPKTSFGYRLCILSFSFPSKARVKMPTVEIEKMMWNIVFHVGLVVDMVNFKRPLDFEETFETGYLF